MPNKEERQSACILEFQQTKLWGRHFVSHKDSPNDCTLKAVLHATLMCRNGINAFLSSWSPASRESQKLCLTTLINILGSLEILRNLSGILYLSRKYQMSVHPRINFKESETCIGLNKSVFPLLPFWFITFQHCGFYFGLHSQQFYCSLVILLTSLGVYGLQRIIWSFQYGPAIVVYYTLMMIFLKITWLELGSHCKNIH